MAEVRLDAVTGCSWRSICQSPDVADGYERVLCTSNEPHGSFDLACRAAAGVKSNGQSLPNDRAHLRTVVLALFPQQNGSSASHFIRTPKITSSEACGGD